MARYEKTTTVVSVVALVLAAANPFIVYRWLNPPLKEIKQELKQRARLQVSSNRGSSDYHMQVMRKIIMDDDSDTVPVADELTKLADLRDRGILTPEEFDRQKPKLLGG